MAEVLSPIGEVFDAPEFGVAFTEWQYSRMTAQKRDQQLANHVANPYEDDGSRTKYEIDSLVDDALAMDPEDFAGAFSSDSEALNLAKMRDSADQKEREAKASVLEKAGELGLGQFSLYGLWLHLRESGVVQKSDLRAKVLQAELDFEAVNKLIRENSGRLLTFLDLGVYAGRLASGGIALDDKHNVVVPTEGACYAMSFLGDSDKLHQTDRIHVNASDIHSIFGSGEAKLFDGWHHLLNIDKAYTVNEPVFAVGEVVEGAPNITAHERDRDFYQRIFERTRVVSKMALLNS